MKKIERVDLSFGNINYHLKLTGRITVVSGNSGTGKSYLAHLAFTQSRRYLDKLDECLALGFYSNLSNYKNVIFSVCNGTSPKIIIFDEALLSSDSYEPLKEITAVISRCKNPNVRFVLIGRSLCKRLSCGAKDIMKIVQTGPNDYTFEREDMIPFRNVNQITCDTVICEDSNNGYTIVNAILPKRGFTNVVSASGKDNIPKLMPNYKDEFVAIIMDLCGDAWAYSKLKADYAANQKFFVVDSESFEWECLVCHGTLKRDEPVDTDDFKEYRNEEIYYVKLLAKEIEEFCGLHYTKNNGEKILQLLNNGFFKSELYPELKQIDSGNSGGKDGSTLQKSGLHRFTLSKLEFH